MEQMISELHHKTQEEPGMWIHNWEWTQVTKRPNLTNNHESYLGAADEGETTDNESREQPGPRRSQ